MDITYSTRIITNSSSNFRSVFYCLYASDLRWDLDNTLLSWILVVILYTVSPLTILLNALVIVAVKQRNEFQRHSTILLRSMAVADLLAGALNIPVRATIDALILRQLWIDHICLIDFLNVYAMCCVFFCTLYHLIVIAWERYIAVVKWMDYKVIVTRSRLTKLATTAWLASVLTVIPVAITEGLGTNTQIVEALYIVWIACAGVVFIGMAYLYVRVYFAIRKRRISEISQVTILVKAKLESKVAKTSVLLTTAVIVSMSPAMVFYILGEAFPSIHSAVNFRLWEAPIMLYSLANPILYCYRDCSFNNAVLELLRIRKPRSTEGTVPYARRKYPIEGAEDILKLQNVSKPVVRLLNRATSCDLALVPVCVHGVSHKITLKRSLSAPTLVQCNIVQFANHSPNAEDMIIRRTKPLPQKDCFAE